MRHTTEKDVYNLPSNAEHMLGEESSQSTEHEKINDLRDRGYLEHGQSSCHILILKFLSSIFLC